MRKKKRGAENDKEEGLRKEEVMKAIKKIKDGKAVVGDEIPGEVWREKDARMGLEYVQEDMKE